MAAFALLSAIEYRRRTGEGQHLDISQYEAALHFLAPVLIDYMAGRAGGRPRTANRSDRYAPHGAYQFADEGGEERWVALAVERRRPVAQPSCRSSGSPSNPGSRPSSPGSKPPMSSTTYLQELVRNRPARTTVESLQAAGVAAYPVQNCLDLHSDENLLGFNFWQWLEQRDAGVHALRRPVLPARSDRKQPVGRSEPRAAHRRRSSAEPLGMSRQRDHPATRDRRGQLN